MGRGDTMRHIAGRARVKGLGGILLLGVGALALWAVLMGPKAFAQAESGAQSGTECTGAGRRGHVTTATGAPPGAQPAACHATTGERAHGQDRAPGPQRVGYAAGVSRHQAPGRRTGRYRGGRPVALRRGDPRRGAPGVECDRGSPRVWPEFVRGLGGQSPPP